MGVRGVFLFAIFALVSCNSHVSKTAPQRSGDLPWFERLEVVVFEPYCQRCHSGDAPAGGVMLTDYESVMHSGILEPGSAEDSMLYQTLRDGVMPTSGPKPTAEEIEMVKKWIDMGAPEN